MRTISSMMFRSRRVPCRTKVFLLRPDGTRAAGELHDVGLSGARLSGVPDLAGGDDLRIDCAGRVRTARVRWLRGTAAGLLFREPLSRRELRALAGAAGSALAASTSHDGPSASPLSRGTRPDRRPPPDRTADRAALIAAIAASFTEAAALAPERRGA